MMRKAMIDSATTITKNCLMDFDQATLVLSMLERHDEFSEIGVDIKYDFDDLEAIGDCENKLLVIFDIPRTVYMPKFFGEFYKALNSESAVSKPKER